MVVSCRAVPVAVKGSVEYGILIDVENPGPLEKMNYTLALGSPHTSKIATFADIDVVSREIPTIKGVLDGIRTKKTSVAGALFRGDNAGVQLTFKSDQGQKHKAVAVIIDTRRTKLSARRFTSNKEALAHVGDVLDALTEGRFEWSAAKIQEPDDRGCTGQKNTRSA